ncbi:flavocytochrome c [Isachenkonia alkalipeptolytica]|uniref:Urocanate reductase n=1 Tax=Isachenkonia alkalipeptolytica TaxID=2565777 RepID=A0AA44BF06_9CLOT|nr:flavocytochrome c [Isachenkonia alkalipeptolytica]NBG89577.1 flavocytochrome c [Isachenkonia alkalipeptolytica]
MKGWKKKTAWFLLLILMAVTLGACNGEEDIDEVEAPEGKYQDGEYVATAPGHEGPIEVKVTVENQDIASIEVLDHNETPVLTDPAFEKIMPAMEEHKTTNVDTVSGATLTSLGIIRGVRNALVEAGGNEELFTEDEKITFAEEAENLEETYDVVVIGGGGAGLSAAIEAQENGAQVVLLEKMHALGGNTLVSGGGLNAPNTEQQERNDVEDSVDQFIEDTLEGGDHQNDEALVSIMAEEAEGVTQWLQEEIGVNFISDRLQQFGGHSVPRALIADGNKGVELIEKLEEKARDLGVTFKMATEATELIMDDQGRVTEVKAKNEAEQELTFHANRSVVVATGGFGDNLEMRQSFNEEYDDRYMTTVVPATTGDGISMAEEIEANFVDMEEIQTYPTCNPQTGVISYVANSRFDGAILVNQEGERFINEMGRRDTISQGILDQTDQQAYLIWGQEIEEVGNMTSLHEKEFQNLKDNDLIYQSDDLGDLAAKFDVEEEALLETLEEYNAFIQEGEAIDIEKTGSQRTVEEGPFYIQKVVPAVHHTMGGIKINENAQVLDVNDERIEGLYAAGEVTGGIHGANRLGGNAITDILVFGRIAGENAAKE